MKREEIRTTVRQGYGRIAKDGGGCCGGARAETIGRRIGYSKKEMKAVPAGANLGLGCGNPVAFASLRKGETVLDLGSGAGFDCFLAAQRVGLRGRVIGVDMTSEMLERARANARKSGQANVEFRLGEIEHLPVADASADVVISNCVINLSPDKARVFKEAFRVLKPGGRLMVSDIVLLKRLPAPIRRSVAAYIGCLAGALLKRDYLKAIRSAGFRGIRVAAEDSYPVEVMVNDPTGKTAVKNLRLPREKLERIARSVLSIKVEAVKPDAS